MLHNILRIKKKNTNIHRPTKKRIQKMTKYYCDRCQKELTWREARSNKFEEIPGYLVFCKPCCMIWVEYREKLNKIKTKLIQKFLKNK